MEGNILDDEIEIGDCRLGPDEFEMSFSHRSGGWPTSDGSAYQPLRLKRSHLDGNRCRLGWRASKGPTYRADVGRNRHLGEQPASVSRIGLPVSRAVWSNSAERDSRALIGSMPFA